MTLSLFPLYIMAQGWPSNYGGVMLQGFYWDSYADSQWSYLEEQSKDIAPYFNLIWIPQSGYCGSSNNMGYTPQYYFTHDSSFGTEGQLRSMIKTYKELGTGFIADVVINHRNNLGNGGSWVDYPAENYNGVNYQMLPSDIVKNDDGGKTLAWANKNGISLSENNDTGEGWDGCRDIDHKSENVNKIVKAYLDFLLNDLGYAGFRYDMVKGYSASYTGDYNSTAKPEFSVGEYWDGNPSVVQKWIDGTKVNDEIQSAAFDFAFRYSCRDAAHGTTNNLKPGAKVTPNWSKLLNSTSATSGYKRYSVTFVENHDTEYRSSSAPQDPIVSDTLALNAWLLGNPGTPCVFYKHWRSYKKDIKLMIEARKIAGINNQSSFSNITSNSTTDYCARRVYGKNGTMIIVVGSNCNSYSIPEGFTEILSGYHYRYLLSNDCDQSSWNNIVARIEEEEKPKEFTPYKATVHVKADFTPVYFYIWDSNNNTQLNGGWPGKRVDNVDSYKTTIDGETWYVQSVDITSADYYFNIIFNQGSGKPQTSDISHITTDKYYVASISGGKVSYEDVTSNYTTGITYLIDDDLSGVADIYSIDGYLIYKNVSLEETFVKLKSGIYVINGKKVIK